MDKVMISFKGKRGEWVATHSTPFSSAPAINFNQERIYVILLTDW